MEFFPKPKMFRAGRYGANDDTMMVLQDLGVEWDSSYFPGHSRIKYSFIREFPIGTYMKYGVLRRKYDIDWTPIDRIEKDQPRHIMGHSYSDPKKLEAILKVINVEELSYE